MGKNTAATAQRAMQDLRIELGILTDRVAVAAGLRPSDLAILDVVVHDGSVTPTHLARRTGIHPATLTGALARLERDGWLKRRRDAADSRSVVITAVPKRVERLERIYAGVNRLLARAMADVTTDEWRVIIGYLERARQAIATENAPA